MKPATLTVLAVFAAIWAFGCSRAPYVAPVADGAGPESSPPFLEGRIANIAVSPIGIELGVIGRSSEDSFPIRLTDNTSLLTVYGGHVLPSELLVGQRVRVWLTTPGSPRRGEAAEAAVVMLASMDPNDDWP